MDTSPDKSGAHQFSLRKLLLWIAVFAVYLGVLRLREMGLYSTIVVLLCVHLLVRLINWLDAHWAKK